MFFFNQKSPVDAGASSSSKEIEKCVNIEKGNKMIKKVTAYVGYKLPSNPTAYVGPKYSKSDGAVIDILHIYRRASKASIDRIMGGVNG